jgi:hypothetical protein
MIATIAAASGAIAVGAVVTLIAFGLGAALLLARLLERRDTKRRHPGDHGPDPDEDGGGGGGPGGDDEPPWWPDFERDLTAYLASDRAAGSPGRRARRP